MIRWRIAGMAFLSFVGCLDASASDPATPDEVTTSSGETLSFQILQNRLYQRADGSSVTINRVTPPTVAGPQATPSLMRLTLPVTNALNAGITNDDIPRYHILCLSATVYAHRYTVLRWWFGGSLFTAISNIDFNLCSSIADFDAPSLDSTDSGRSVVYSLIMGIGNEANALSPLPSELAQISSGHSGYVVTNGDPTLPINPDALAPLDALHFYFDAHSDDLRQAYHSRIAASIARVRYLRDHPPGPPSTIINMWPRKSRAYLPSGVRSSP